jgi:DNA-binding winged helix-turn-helix (wHTH) protein/tetratricopeptide (TPR) repeat protein
VAQARRWHFGRFEVDEGEHRLWRDGRVVRLTHKSFALLVVLLVRAGQLVTKAELFDSVWAGRTVSDAALSRALRELRVALGDDAAQPSYVQTAHGLGLRFVATVHAAPPAVVVPPVSVTGAVRLAGRSSELASLDDAISAATAGLRELVFVTGPAGIGKTALVEAALAKHQEVWLAAGRCIEQYGAAEPYLPLLEALEHLAPQVGAASLRDHLLRVAPGWLAQLPWLAHDVEPEAMRRALHAQSPSRLLRELAQALEMLAQRRTVVLWLEDLHWCDHSSIDALAFLAGRRDSARLLIVGSLRPPQTLDSTAPLPHLMHELIARGACRQLALEPLAADAVQDLVRMRLPAGPTPVDAALAMLVYRRSEGNPLFAQAIVDDLLHGGQLVASADGWSLCGSESEVGHKLPDTLRQLVEAQLGALVEDDRRLVEAAAVGGPTFSAAAVAAAIRADPADVEERCARLTGAGGFFRTRESCSWPDGSFSAGFAFVHALYWEAVFERVPDGRRAAWQRRIGERMEEAYATERGTVATELAMRFEAARDPHRAIAYLRMAADGALARFAYREAVGLLRRGLKLAPQLPPIESPRATMDLLLPLGAALIATRGYASPEVQEVYERASSLGRELAAPRDLERALRGLWNVALVRADLRQAARLANELMARADAGGADPARSFDAHAKVGQTHLHLGQFAQANDHLSRALAMPLDSAAPAREAPRVAGYLAWVLWYAGKPDQAMALATRALELARVAANPHSSAFALGFVGFVHAFRGEWNRADDMARAQGVLAAEHGLAYWEAWSNLLRGLAAAVGRRDAAGLTVLRSALDAFSSMGAEVGLSHFQCEHAQACLMHDALDAARQALASARELLLRNGNAYHAAETHRLQAEWLLAADGTQRFDEARRSFGRAIQVAQRQGAVALQLRSLAGSVRAARRFGRPAAVETEQLGRLLSACAEGRDTADIVQVSMLLAENAG